MSKSIYPSIPSPGNTPESQRATLDALRQTITLVIMNAQNPNPNFTASSAAQVFVTKDELKATGVVGEKGPAGPQGVPGPGIEEAPNDVNTYARHALTWTAITGILVDAPNDANTYGRHAAGWQMVLPLSGGALTGALTLVSLVFGTLPVNAINDAAAASAGVPVGGVYRNASQLMVRVA